jgi:hypothetical protein
MNKIINTLLFAAAIAVAGCTKDMDEPVSARSEAVYDGNWVITYFAEEKDETEIFKDYTFSFHTDGTLRVSKGTESYTGTWKDISKDGKTILSIRVNSINLVQRFTDDWEIVSFTDDAMQLNDVSIARNKVMHLARL